MGRIGIPGIIILEIGMKKITALEYPVRSYESEVGCCVSFTHWTIIVHLTCTLVRTTMQISLGIWVLWDSYYYLSLVFTGINYSRAFRSRGSHCFFTIMNIKRKDTFQFCFPGLLNIHTNPNWKEFLKRCESQHFKIPFNLGSYECPASLESKIGRCPFFWYS